MCKYKTFIKNIFYKIIELNIIKLISFLKYNLSRVFEAKNLVKTNKQKDRQSVTLNLFQGLTSPKSARSKGKMLKRASH